MPVLKLAELKKQVWFQQKKFLNVKSIYTKTPQRRYLKMVEILDNRDSLYDNKTEK